MGEGLVTLDADLGVVVGGFDLDVALTVPSGTTAAVVGPNGSGKTTLLLALAGLVRLHRGHVRLGERTLDDPGRGVAVDPERRRIAIVFQELLLFPHLDAVANVAFGLEAGGAKRSRARAEAAAWLGRAGLGHRARQRPRALSGGEAQRVALGRALVTGPQMLLLDEPFAAMDAAARPALRRDLLGALGEMDGPSVLVTHDVVEAATLADDIHVIENGRVVQRGTLAELTASPRSPYVAALAGTNLLTGQADGAGDIVLAGGVRLHTATELRGPALATIAPHAVALSVERPLGSARNVWDVTVESIEPVGARRRVRLGGAVPIVAEVTDAAVSELGLRPGMRAWASVKATEVGVAAA